MLLHVGSQAARTKTAFKTVQPVYNETFEFIADIATTQDVEVEVCGAGELFGRTSSQRMADAMLRWNKPAAGVSELNISFAWIVTSAA